MIKKYTNHNSYNSKGFSLIEIIIYISLLSILMIGVFSSVLGFVYTSMKKPIFTEDDYKLLIKNFHDKSGFVAMTLVITVSSMLLALCYMQSINTTEFVDEALRKQYRYMNYYNAYNCIDQAILNISHDFFYEIYNEINIPEQNCSIRVENSKYNTKIIEAKGNFKNIIVKKIATVRLYDNRLEVISIE